jgi:Peptidase propeptide and YPEB domain
VSTGDTSSNGPEPAATRPRDLRDNAYVRVAILVALLLVAFLVTKSCARQQNEVSQDEAVAIAKEHVDFTPDDYQVKYLPQGVPPVYYWAVSLYTVENGQPDHVEVVLVNATTGAVNP